MFLVTSIWFGVGIPFVGKRKVESVRLSLSVKSLTLRACLRKQMSKKGNEFHVLIKDYSECQQQILCGLSITMLFYVAQYRHDVPLMEYALREGCEKTVRDETLLDTILDVFNY